MCLLVKRLSKIDDHMFLYIYILKRKKTAPQPPTENYVKCHKVPTAVRRNKITGNLVYKLSNDVLFINN